MKMQSIEDLMYTGLTYVHDFEQQVSKEASKMAEASTNPELKEMFEKSVTQGQKYAERIQQTFTKLGKKADANENPIAKAMIDEVENMIANTDPSPVRDAALIVAVNQQQAYRVASYGSFRTFAELLGKNDAVEQMKQSLEECKAGDEKFTQLANSKVNQEAAQSAVAA